MIATATYRNLATGSTYRLAIEMQPEETKLAAAWRVIGSAAAIAGWNALDAMVDSAA